MVVADTKSPSDLNTFQWVSPDSLKNLTPDDVIKNVDPNLGPDVKAGVRQILQRTQPLGLSRVLTREGNKGSDPFVAGKRYQKVILAAAHRALNATASIDLTRLSGSSPLLRGTQPKEGPKEVDERGGSPDALPPVGLPETELEQPTPQIEPSPSSPVAVAPKAKAPPPLPTTQAERLKTALEDPELPSLKEARIKARNTGKVLAALDEYTKLSKLKGDLIVQREEDRKAGRPTKVTDQDIKETQVLANTAYRTYNALASLVTLERLGSKKLERDFPELNIPAAQREYDTASSDLYRLTGGVFSKHESRLASLVDPTSWSNYEGDLLTAQRKAEGEASSKLRPSFQRSDPNRVDTSLLMRLLTQQQWGTSR